MKDIKIESRYGKVYLEFLAFIRCMEVGFCRPDFQKFLMCLLIKRPGRVFLLKARGRAFQILSRAFEALTF